MKTLDESLISLIAQLGHDLVEVTASLEDTRSNYNSYRGKLKEIQALLKEGHSEDATDKIKSIVRWI